MCLVLCVVCGKSQLFFIIAQQVHKRSPCYGLADDKDCLRFEYNEEVAGAAVGAIECIVEEEARIGITI